MQKISATIITCNEETNIAEALKALAWVDETVVVDSGSMDGTLDVCRRYTDKVFHRDWTGYVDQKNYAVERASHDWILSLDADERPSPELVAEIEVLRRSGLHYAGYRLPRLTFFMGRWIRHGDWYPDYQLRLFDRRKGRWQGGRVHESVRLEGSHGILKGEIYHYTYRSLSDYLRRLEVYSSLAAEDFRQRGRHSSALQLLGNPPVTFLKGYLLKGGFLDGVPGLMAAVMGAISVYFKYAKLYELQQTPAGKAPEEAGKKR
jgi:glycosyltransferase involved in cell wall biosynthesis